MNGNSITNPERRIPVPERRMVRIDDEFVRPYLDETAFESILSAAAEAHQTVLQKSGAGSEYLGWRDLLLDPNDALLQNVADVADEIRREADVLVCIGIGGSYLGAKAVIQALTPYLRGADAPGPEIVFAGHHISGAYVRELLDYIGGRSVYVNVISKSGTTLEPALAFRFVRQFVEDSFDDPERRIIVTTDPQKGALNTLHQERGYRKFAIPPDVGGRFSVLTPVGLLPIAAAGIDIVSLFYGAVAAAEDLAETHDNDAVRYAALRYAMLQDGKTVDLFSVFEPRLRGIGEWWQQLFGESEGKEGKALFPAVAQYSTDLHSLGQYVQDGKRTLLETFLMVENDEGSLPVPHSDDNLDGLNYLQGRTMSDVNRAAYEGTARAHAAGRVPNLTVWLDRISPGAIGETIYFFEHAVAVSGYLIGVNPFDQPGVEAYKNEMFRLLGRP